MSPERRRHISSEFLISDPHHYHSRNSHPSEEIELPDKLIRFGNLGPEFLGTSSLEILLGEMGIFPVSKKNKGKYWFFKPLINEVERAFQSAHKRRYGFSGSPPMKWSRDNNSQKTILVSGTDTKLIVEKNGLVIDVVVGPNYLLLLNTLSQLGEILIPRTRGGKGESRLESGIDSRKFFEELGFHNFRLIDFQNIYDSLIHKEMSTERKQTVTNENNKLLTYASRYERYFYLCSPPLNSEVETNSVGAVITNRTDLHSDRISILWRPKWKFRGKWVDASWSVSHKRTEIRPELSFPLLLSKNTESENRQIILPFHFRANKLVGFPEISEIEANNSEYNYPFNIPQPKNIWELMRYLEFVGFEIINRDNLKRKWPNFFVATLPRNWGLKLSDKIISVLNDIGKKTIEVTLEVVSGKGFIKASIQYMPEDKSLMAAYIKKEKTSKRIEKIKNIFKR